MRVHGHRVLVDGRWASDVVLTIDDGRIASIEAAALVKSGAAELHADIVAPGLIDLQYNGGFGVEIGSNPESILHLASRLPETGVTAFLPTLVTSQRDAYGAAYEAFRRARQERSEGGAIALGMHLEGPFLSPSAAGAHHREWLDAGDAAFFDALAAPDVLSLMTLAPELPGALGRIAELARRGIVASIGHTSATYDETIAAIDAGATMATHLYNAMSPFEHRAPGAVGAALVDDRITCGLIVDGVHLHDAAVRLALVAKGGARIALVTDAMAAAGMGPGDYELAGKRVSVDATSARLDDGTLAGSVLTLDQALRNVVALGVPLEDTVRMASEVPARLLGLERKGRIDVGSDADLVLFDDALSVRATVIGGVLAYAAP